MADILIPGVRFPENCAQCFNAHDEYCYLLNRRLVTKDWVQRKDDCPLVPVPPHGDLISLKDAETVIDRFLGYLDEEMIYRIKYKLNQDCPVIVPADKEETE